MSIPNLSEFNIRHNANAKSFERGEAYYKDGAVAALTQRVMVEKSSRCLLRIWKKGRLVKL